LSKGKPERLKTKAVGIQENYLWIVVRAVHIIFSG